MIVTARDMLLLLALARHFLLTRAKVQQLVCPPDKDGRQARRRLAALAAAGLIYRHTTLVASSHDAAPAPVYLLTSKGCQYLADKLGDASFLHKPVHLPHPLHLVHAMAVADLHIMFDAAVAAQTDVVLEVWFNEHDVVNAGEPDPAHHYRLRTKFAGEPEIICSPDAGFVLNRDGQRVAYYLELERGDGHRGTGARQLAERKCPGYAELARQKIYLNHFPGVEVDEFRVLLIVPHDRRRDAVRRAFAKKDPSQFRTDLWRFAAMTDLTAETFLTGEVFYHCGAAPAERLLPVGMTNRSITTLRRSPAGRRRCYYNGLATKEDNHVQEEGPEAGRGQKQSGCVEYPGHKFCRPGSKDVCLHHAERRP